MNRTFKTAVLGVALAATTLTAIPSAQASDRRHRGDAIAAGVIGLAAGAIIGSALSQPRYREPIYEDGYYVEPRPVYRPRYVTRVYEEPVYVRRSAEPWTREWYRYCQNRYRSFDSSSGTYIGYDGREHFCVAN